MHVREARQHRRRFDWQRKTGWLDYKNRLSRLNRNRVTTLGIGANDGLTIAYHHAFDAFTETLLQHAPARHR
jgi:hypothetical protein